MLAVLASLATSLVASQPPSHVAAVGSSGPAIPPDVPRVTVTGPVSGGAGIDLPGTTSFNLRTVGYEQSEYFLAGMATAFAAVRP